MGWHHILLLYLEKLLCWLEQEEQEGHWLLVPKVEAPGLSFSTAILVRQAKQLPSCYYPIRKCFHVKITQLSSLTVSFFGKERAKALADAVSGEALPYECLHEFCPEKGMILANASAIGMEPNSDQSPVPKVNFLLSLLHMYSY